MLTALVLTYFGERPGDSGSSHLTTSGNPTPSPAPLTISSFTVNSTTFYIEAPVWFNITADGGSPPYSYGYQGLPPGCASQNTSSLLCYPSSAQHYEIVGTVNDTAGHEVNATANLTVKNGFGLPPKILSFHAYPDLVAVNKITYLSVDAVPQSGTPPLELAYAFIGLPPGCGTFNQSNLSCIPSQPGMYKVWVRVTDSYAQFNQTYLFLNVTGTATPTSPGSSSIDPFLAEAGIAVVAAAIVMGGIFLYVRSRAKRLAKPPPDSPGNPPGSPP